MNKASKDILTYASLIDKSKDVLMNVKLSDNDFKEIMSIDDVEGIVLYYAFLNRYKDDAFEMEIETIDSIVGKYSQYNAERLKAMTSILKTDAVFYDVTAFNIMIEAFNHHEITAQTIEPYSAEEIAWTFINVIGIWGANNFPFKGNALRYIKACLDWEGWELPPLFMSFPVILDMYETSVLQKYAKITKPLENVHIYGISTLCDSSDFTRTLGDKVHLINYLLNNCAASKYLVNKIEKAKAEIRLFFLKN
jgi:hypothetical protein